MTQLQHYLAAQAANNETLQQAAYMAGLLKDNDGQFCPNPLTDDEINQAARANQPYSWAFEMIASSKQRIENAH